MSNYFGRKQEIYFEFFCTYHKNIFLNVQTQEIPFVKKSTLT